MDYTSEKTAAFLWVMLTAADLNDNGLPGEQLMSCILGLADISGFPASQEPFLGIISCRI